MQQTNGVRCSDESRGVVTEWTCGYSAGLKKMERDEVSGVKLVVRPFETP